MELCGKTAMKLVDAHLHLSDPELGVPIDRFLQEAETAGVKALVSASSSYDDAVKVLALVREHGALVRAAVGIHPWTAVEGKVGEVDRIRELVRDNRAMITAIGEVGLDGKYSHDSEVMARQRDVFGKMLSIAQENSLPVVVHSRLAVDEVLRQTAKFDLKGVLLHWYSGPVDQLETIRESEYYISVGPSVAYSKRIIEIAKNATMEMILTETDAPVRYYGQFKGRMTSPRFIPEVVEGIARIKAIPTETAARQIMDNFERLFGS